MLKQRDIRGGIPSLTLAEILDETPSAGLVRACEDWGFFRLMEHNLDSELQNQMLELMHEFFADSSAIKRQYLRTDKNPWGFYDQELTKNRQDWKEIFDLGIDQTDPTYTSQTPWPKNPANFKTIMLAWHRLCDELSQKLLAGICRSLGHPSSQLERHFRPGNTSFLRLNYYPACPTPASASEDFPESGELGIHHHTDAGALTILLQDEVAGLQVRHQNSWHTVATEPGSVIINIGDLVQVWSNDRYQAPLHRVLANLNKERYSAAFFYNPAFETECSPLETEKPKYHTVNWGRFRASRAAGDYANRGEEIQISDFRTGH